MVTLDKMQWSIAQVEENTISYVQYRFYNYGIAAMRKSLLKENNKKSYF